MPLAHLRYYGKPEERHRTLDSSTPRVSYRQFLLIAMGSLASQWTIRDAPGETIAAFLVALENATGGELGNSWLTALGHEAQTYLDSSAPARGEMDRFIKLGRRRPGILATKFHHPLDCFGLSQPAFYLTFMDFELQIQTLRNLASQFIPEERLDHAVIVSHRPGLEISEYANVRPQSVPGLSQKRHCRWIFLPIRSFEQKSSNVFDFDDSLTLVYEDISTQRRWFQPGKDAALHRSMEIVCMTQEPCGFLDVPFEFFDASFEKFDPQTFHWHHYSARDPVVTVEELRKGAFQRSSAWDIDQCTQGWRPGQYCPPYRGRTYKCAFRASAISAIYEPISMKGETRYIHARPDAISPETVTSQLREQVFPATWLRMYLQQFLVKENERYASYFSSIEALACAGEVYNALPNAEIDLKFQTNLSSFSWVKAWRNSQRRLTVGHFSLPG